MLEFLARIRIYEEDVGCSIKGDGWSGMMPSFNLNGNLIASKIIYEKEKIPRGEWCDVLIQLPYGNAFDEIKNNIKIGLEFKLNIGGIVFGEGIVTER